jgi:hypothetical protein
MADVVKKYVIHVVYEKSQAEKDAKTRSRAEINLQDIEKIVADAKIEAHVRVDSSLAKLDRDDAARRRKRIADWGKQAEAVEGSLASVLRSDAGMATPATAGTALSKIVEHFNEVRLAAIATGDDLIRYAQELRQLGALEGDVGPEETLARRVQFRAQTLQTAHDVAATHHAMMKSSSGAIKGGLVAKTDIERLAVTVGQFQTPTGESPEAIGNVAGGLPMTMYRAGRPNVGAYQMTGMMEQINTFRNLGGFESFTQAVTELGKVKPWVSAVMLTVEEAMTLLSAVAHGGGGNEAGTRIHQLMRMTSMGPIRAGKMSLGAEFAGQQEVSSEHHKRIGVAEDTSSYDTIIKIAEDLEKQRQDWFKKHKTTFNALKFLGEKGQINVESDFAALQIYSMMHQGTWRDLKEGAMAPRDPTGTKRDFDTFVAQSPTAKRIRADTDADVANLGLASTQQEPWKQSMMREGYARLEPKEVPREFEDIKSGGYLDVEAMYHRSKMESQAGRMLLDEAARLGIMPESTSNLRPSPEAALRDGSFTGWESLGRLCRQVEAVGGEGTPPVSMERVESILTEIRDDLRLGRPAPVGVLPARLLAPPPALPATPPNRPSRPTP